jgi:hypothetical protein
MSKKVTKYPFLLVLVLFFYLPVSGQFYNGMQMTFGKNRVQYNEFYWQYYRFERFDTYFNEYGRDLALYTEWFANQEIKRLESLLDYTLDRRIIFLIYNKLTDFRQSNIGLVTGIDDYNVGGVTRVINNKISLYYEGDHLKFQRQITSSIAELMLNEMLYGNELGQNVTNSMLISFPDWFMKGLLSYLAENWSVETEGFVKDGIISGRFKKFNRLTGNEALYAGHSFWRYIEKTYGRNVIPNIIYLIRVNKNLKSGFLYVLGSSIKDITRDWYRYYSDKYANIKDETLDYGQLVEKHPRQRRVYNNVKVSPDGKHLAYVTNELGQFKIWLYNIEKGKKKRLLKREQRIDQIPDYTFPVLSWHPNGHILSFITEEKGGLVLSFYDIETRELTSRNLLYFEKVLDYSFSADGSKFVCSAMKLGKTDIYVHSLASATDEQITNDLADDLTPRFIDNSKRIIFSSNRMSDTLKAYNVENLEISPYYRLYIIPYPEKTKKMVCLSEAPFANHTQPYEISSNRFIYLGDDNGVVNRYLAEYDSAISLVDTAIHYRYYTKTYPLTNQSRNILQQDYTKKPNRLIQLFFNKSKYSMYNNEFFSNAQPGMLPASDYRIDLLKSIQKKLRADSLKQINEIKKALLLSAKQSADSIKKLTQKIAEPEIDINHYIFEIEKRDVTQERKYKDALKAKNYADSIAADNEKKIRIYLPSFYINMLVNQVDFAFLNASYQPFNGAGGYFSPGFNVNLKLGTNDLFDDYKIIGGLRFGVDFESNEYLLSVENLKKRLDKQFIFHRTAYKTVLAEEDVYNYVKTTTNEGYYVLRYPLNQVFSVRGTASLRYDRTAFLAIDRLTLEMPNRYDVWGGVKGELIFDNSRKIGLNIYSGTRTKIFAEAYKQINRGKSDLFVLGADYRHYLVIHRNLILANRVAASTSFGGSRLIYYLGGVDNWINFSSVTPTFDYSIRIDDQGKYAFQTLATNMRGFSQNVRNGNNFAVMNNEIRWPFITYFSRFPVSSAFWNSLQAVGFFDTGTAWTGWNPFSGNNAYDFDEISYPEGQTDPTMTIRVDSNRAPVVFGYGFGLRAQLLGYFVRFDWAWGIENSVILPRVFYLSFSLDF